MTARLVASAETVATVKEGLRAVVAEGTGWRARLRSVDVCGKTGTAQVVSRERLKRTPDDPSIQPHGWFVAFAPADEPQVALAVIVEHGGGGGVAAEVARAILARFFRGQKPPATAPSVDAGD